MTTKLKIVLAQLNLHVGNINDNLEKHIHAAITARDKYSANIIVFSELGITGYPPEDLLLRKYFIEDANAALQKFISEVKDIHCIIGHPHATSLGIQNSCSVIYNGSILGRYAKQHLPNYGVFDECRYFTSGNMSCVIPINGVPVGIVICEDLWHPEPVRQAASQGARVILAPNASPFETDKHEHRVAMLTKHTKHNRVPIVYVNQIGGQDELLFDGGSMVMSEHGKVAQFAGFFNQTLLPAEFNITASETQINAAEFIIPDILERTYDGLVTGVRDYITKNNFPGVIVGVSGGIDSALTLAIAVDALGKDRVTAVMMPSRYTADMSNEDAASLAKSLHVKTETFSIESVYEEFIRILSPSFNDKKVEITEQNIQARCRAILLMALSNKTGRLVLTTGNRSEIAVGYCTLYGDMAGGFAVLKDIPKTLVYELANYRNHISPVIPERTITRPPTAELAPDQKDEDTLPPYSILDKILECYLNHSQSAEEIISQGFNSEVVLKVINLIHKNEYKRKQSALGPRINHKSFGKDWRYPNTNGFKG